MYTIVYPRVHNRALSISSVGISHTGYPEASDGVHLPIRLRLSGDKPPHERSPRAEQTGRDETPFPTLTGERRRESTRIVIFVTAVRRSPLLVRWGQMNKQQES